MTGGAIDAPAIARPVTAVPGRAYHLAGEVRRVSGAAKSLLAAKATAARLSPSSGVAASDTNAVTSHVVKVLDFSRWTSTAHVGLATSPTA